MAEKRNLQNISEVIGTSSVEVLTENNKRTYLMVQNKSSVNNLYLVFGATATVALGILIPPGVAYEPPYEVISSVNLISDQSGTDCVIVTNVGAE